MKRKLSRALTEPAAQQPLATSGFFMFLTAE